MATTLASGVSRKLKKVLETRTDSPDILSSLAALSSFYADNTPQARRNLKSSIEQRGLAINGHFLDAALPAQLALERVEAEVNALTECCNQIEKTLNSSSGSTGDIISTTERLQQELEIITQRQEIVSCFLRDYQLSDEEINALREDELGENFFSALSHVQEIHSSCKILLRTHHQRAGLELMDLMSVYQESAFERLCRWVQVECKKLGDTDNPEVGFLLKKAVRCLMERPVLFKYCAEEVANMRHHALFRRFISALTRGGPGGLPRPIEVHAHDPLRYVGDMLGWLHQAVASERELITVLLDPDAMTDNGPIIRPFSKNGDNENLKMEPDITSVLDRIFEGACRPFKVRVEQVLQTQPGLIVSYKLTNTLEFYNYTIAELLGRDTSLCNTIRSLKEASQETFFSNLRSRGDKLLRYPPLIASDLSPPAAVREGISLLLELIDTYNSMMVRTSGQRPDFDPVITALLDPIIQMCEQAVESQKSKGSIGRRRISTDFASSGRESISVDAILSKTISTLSQESSLKIFLINCMSAIEEAVLEQEVAENYMKTLHSKIETHMNALIDNEVDVLLQRCGLASKLSYINHTATSGIEASSRPLNDIPEMAPQVLSECLKSFFGLVAGTEGSLPEFEQLQVPKLRSKASYDVARALADAYEIIYNAVMDPRNGYSEPRLVVKHSPTQITTMLAL